jgi:acetylornithine deacetylase/succinyl-diaminopimelate desuccinylase family protein
MDKTTPAALQQMEERLSGQFTQDEAVQIATGLLAVESHRYAPGHETPVAIHVRDLLEREGIAAELVDVRDGRCNVIATLKGTGGGPRLMFNGHLDTVPPGEMLRPFEPHVVDGQLRARGACDMKGGIAAQLYAMIGLKRAGIALRGDLIFAGVIAEEDSTSLGTLHVIEHGPKADMAIVAEPSGLEIIVAHKGFDYYNIAVEGIPAHSSRPSAGLSAIYKAARIVSAIEDRLIPRTNERTHKLLGPASINVAAILGFARNEEMAALRRGPADKPAGATVPDSCTIYLDRRRIPGETLEGVAGEFEALLDELRNEDKRLDATLHFTPACPELPSHPPLDTDPGHPLVREGLRIAAEERRVKTAVTGVPFWSDAALLNTMAGIPAIVFGPGDVAFAHSNTEFVPVHELLVAARINARLALALLA